MGQGILTLHVSFIPPPGPLPSPTRPPHQGLPTCDSHALGTPPTQVPIEVFPLPHSCTWKNLMFALKAMYLFHLLSVDLEKGNAF